MGLAPYGKPLYVEQIKKELIFIHKDGSFKLNLDVFNFVKGNDYISKHFSRIFKMPRRQPEDEIIQFYKDLASSVQQVTEEVVYGLAKYAKSITNSSNLCLAGGVALNCVSNGKLKESDLFSNIWVQPASGDSGSSLGAAYLALYSKFNICRTTSDNPSDDKMHNCYLGPSFTSSEIESFLNTVNASYQQLPQSQVTKIIANDIADGKVVGWFNGRMEFGPRALGNRSILGDQEIQK